MNKKTVFVIGIVLLVFVGGLVLIASARKAPETIKIGLVAPLTGSLASIGESSLGGALLAVDEINNSGGIFGKQIELVVEDDSCSANGAHAITKLITVDDVVAISGPDCSSSASAALPIAQDAGVPTVIRWASAPSLTKIGDYIFRVYPSDAFQGKFIAEYMYGELGLRNVGVLYVKNDWGQGITDVFIKRFEELGGVVSYQEGVLEESRDLRAQVNKLKNSDINALFAPLHAATGVIGLKQMKELGVIIPVIGGDVFESAEVQESPGASGVQFSAAVIENPTDFQERIAQVTGKNGTKVTAALGYDSIMVIAQAIERAGSTDRKDVREALTQTHYEGVAFPSITFDADGDLEDARYEIKTIP